MTKKTKTFAKFSKSGEGEKNLLSGDEDQAGDSEEVPEATDTDDDFPIEPTVAREGDDIFNNSTSEVDFEADFSAPGAFEGGSFNDNDKQAFESGDFSNGDVFEGGEFPDAAIFDGDGSGETSNMDFSGHAKDEEDDVELGEDVCFDAAFDASFSGLNMVVKASQEQAQEQPDTNIAGVKPKGRRRLTSLFKRKEEAPVSHCGEIVVDKSKIPTKKVEIALKDGELVAIGGSNHEQNAGEEKSSKNRFKALTKTLKKKSAVIASGLAGPSKDRMDENTDNDAAEIECIDDSDEKDNSEENGEHEESRRPSKKGGELGRSRQVRRRRSSKSAGEVPPAEWQRRRRRESRIDGHKTGTPSRPGGQKSRSSSDDGTGGGRVRRSRAPEEEAKMRRNRTTEASGGGRRRQSLLEKHSGAPNSPHRKAKQSIGDALDESNPASGRHRNRDDSSKVSSKSEMTDGSGRRGSRRRENEVDGSSRRPSSNREETMDGSARRRRDTGARRESRKTIRKSLSGDGSEAKKPDSLSCSAHDAFRRSHTDSSVKFQRAQSTRRFGKNDLLGESGHRNVTSRDRIRRAAAKDSEINDDKASNTKQALGNLYSGSSRAKNGETEKGGADEPPALEHFSSEGDVIEEGEEEDSSEDETPLEDANITGDELDEDDTESGDEGIEEKESNNALNDALKAAENLSASDVEKLIKAVARRAKSAKDDDDLESIVMGSLHNSTAFSSWIDDEDEASFASDHSDDEDRDEDTSKSGLSRKDIQERTRSYVNAFLTSNGGLVGSDMRVGRQVTAQLKYFPDSGVGKASKPTSKTRRESAMRDGSSKVESSKATRTSARTSRAGSKIEGKTRSRARTVAVAK